MLGYRWWSAGVRGGFDPAPTVGAVNEMLPDGAFEKPEPCAPKAPAPKAPAPKASAPKGPAPKGAAPKVRRGAFARQCWGERST